MIGRNGERRSGISAQAARHDDDDDISYSVQLHFLNYILKSFLFCSYFIANIFLQRRKNYYYPYIIEVICTHVVSSIVTLID